MCVPSQVRSFELISGRNEHLVSSWLVVLWLLLPIVGLIVSVLRFNDSRRCAPAEILAPGPLHMLALLYTGTVTMFSMHKASPLCAWGENEHAWQARTLDGRSLALLHGWTAVEFIMFCSFSLLVMLMPLLMQRQHELESNHLRDDDDDSERV